GVTGYTLTDETESRNELERIRAAGYAIVTEELEVGLASVAVPICNRAGTTVAALNTSVAVTQPTAKDLTDQLPALQAAAAELSRAREFSRRRVRPAPPSSTPGSSMGAGAATSSPSTIGRIVRRRILPERLFGSAETTSTSRNAATAPKSLRTLATNSSVSWPGSISAPAVSTT